jgi:hypothetical protein
MEAVMSNIEVFPNASPASAAGFAQEQFGDADLGHKLRNAALVRTAARICRHPGGTLPDKMGSPANYKSMDLLMNRPEVTHASVLACHRQKTMEKMLACAGTLLILHDDTTLDYSGLGIPELGQVGNGGGRGYLCHNSLVVDPATREVVGLAHQILHKRARVSKKEGVKAKRERADRESRLWSTAMQELGPIPAGKRWLDVADRGADLFEFLATEQKLGRSCLVRASQDRTMQVGHDGQGAKKKLFSYLRSLPGQGKEKNKKVFDNAHGAEREVSLSVSFAPVLLPPPHICRGEYENKPLLVWCVRVFEANPPPQTKGLEWFLTTLEPVESVSKAWEMSTFYECRFVVEEYHKAQKTGCQIEDLQFETAQALQPMIALLSVVAVMLLNLRIACRRADADKRQATELVDGEYEEILRAWRYAKVRGEMTIKEFYMALGRLGGHMNRKSDGMPGWLTLWRGWTKLQAMVDGAAAERRRRRKNVG